MNEAREDSLKAPDPLGRVRLGEATPEPAKREEPSLLGPIGEMRRSGAQPDVSQMMSVTGRKADGSMVSVERTEERLSAGGVAWALADRLRSLAIYWFGYGIALEAAWLVAGLWVKDVQGETGALTVLLAGPLVGLGRDVGLGPFGWFMGAVEGVLALLILWNLDWRTQVKIGAGAVLLIVLKVVILAELNPFLN